MQSKQIVKDPFVKALYRRTSMNLLGSGVKKVGVTSIKTGMSGIKTGVSGIKTGISGIERVGSTIGNTAKSGLENTIGKTAIGKGIGKVGSTVGSGIKGTVGVVGSGIKA